MKKKLPLILIAVLLLILGFIFLYPRLSSFEKPKSGIQYIKNSPNGERPAPLKMKEKFKKIKEGFTLIELLVVIALIGILGAIIYALLNPPHYLQLARDGIRKSDINMISKNLSSYLVNNGKYPATLTDLSTAEKINIPKDPKEPIYKYNYTATNVGFPKYKLCAYLESEEKAWCFISTSNSYSDIDLGDAPPGLVTPTPTSPPGTPTPTTGPTPSPTPSPDQNWIYCANEGETCSFIGTRQVRFGANNSYKYITTTDNIFCNSTPFGGDPAWGFSKKCYYDAGSAIVLSTNYEVVPVIYLGSDTNIPDTTEYTNQVNASFIIVKDWFAGQLGGKTFNLHPAIFMRSNMTDAALQAQYGNGIGIWMRGVKDTTIANNMDPCDPKRLYYFVTPMDNIAGGMVGAENLGCTNHVLPGTTSIPNHMGRLIGGIYDPDWPEWWADEIREAQGGAAHELGHGFGGTCTNGNFDPGGGCTALAHSQSPSIMFSWWEFGQTGVFFDDEKIKILQSPFIH